MKLLIISSAFPPMTMAGEADHAYYLSQYLAKRGCEVHVLTSKGAGTNGAGPVMVHPHMSGWSWSEIPQMVRTIKQCRPEAILIFYSGGPLYHDHSMITFAPTFLKTFFPRIRIITQFENHFPPSAHTLGARIVRKLGRPWFDAFGTLLRGSDHIVLLSHRQGEALSQQYPAFSDKSVVIPPPPLIPIVPDPDRNVRCVGREKLGLDPQEIVLAYFGLIYPGKGLETLVEAFEIVSVRKPGARLVLIGGVGSGDKGARYGEGVRARIEQLGIGQKIIWAGGYESGSQDPSIYLRAADLCVLPMDRGIALNNSSLAAAVAHGLPVVATRGNTVEEPLKHQRNLFLCVPQNPKILAYAIDTVLDDSELYGQLQAGARQLAHEYFSWESVVRRTLDVCFTSK